MAENKMTQQEAAISLLSFDPVIILRDVLRRWYLIVAAALIVGTVSYTHLVPLGNLPRCANFKRRQGGGKAGSKACCLQYALLRHQRYLLKCHPAPSLHCGAVSGKGKHGPATGYSGGAFHAES